MTTSTVQIARGSPCRAGGAERSDVGRGDVGRGDVGRTYTADTWWAQRREASLNWLALGVLLAAWNASNNDAAQAWRRPPALRGYSTVSVRAATLHSVRRTAPTSSGAA